MIVGSRKIKFLEIKFKYTPRVATSHTVHPIAPFPLEQNCPRKIAVYVYAYHHWFFTERHASSEKIA